MRGTSGSQAGKVADHLRPILGCQFGIEVPLGGAGSVHLGKPASGCVPKCRASALGETGRAFIRSGTCIRIQGDLNYHEKKKTRSGLIAQLIPINLFSCPTDLKH